MTFLSLTVSMRFALEKKRLLSGAEIRLAFLFQGKNELCLRRLRCGELRRRAARPRFSNSRASAGSGAVAKTFTNARLADRPRLLRSMHRVGGGQQVAVSTPTTKACRRGPRCGPPAGSLQVHCGSRVGHPSLRLRAIRSMAACAAYNSAQGAATLKIRNLSRISAAETRTMVPACGPGQSMEK